MARMAVIGLGSMGYGMAQSLLRAGHEVDGRDVAAARVAQFQGEGGRTLTDDVLECVVIVVLNAAQTETVITDLAPRLRKGCVLLSCATVAPEFAKRMEAEAHAWGLHYLDAPISGGAAKAAQGALSIMAAGTPEAVAAAQEALDAMAETVFRLGDQAGPGSAMKAVNQLLAGVHIAAMAEAVTFGMTQGVTPAQTVDVIRHCAGTSWMFENRGPHIVDGDYSPRSAVNIWPKDLGIVMDIARDARFSAPLTAAALQQFLAAAGSGLGAEDDAAVAKVYARNAGLTLPGDGR
ncbi:3-hydroxyisobutyrate dehydrogenase/2-hydroxy-3-oxopropionate reductase [Rubricella aquisinus]|uniref:L-threonate dehydrogenase n=1 Tax=Rubricella aquisinus TaxID=2028108 RepID=A0A840X0Y6_9RHOB|nr:L-threonate dehydrogenase [Rubricella aquisinus]MBB5514327.1 3-hydroxyisobutyrate dehydrogenase/2-hydroxy-3-oxopropionate reductase [Rubricella aquisinus]